MPRTALAIPMGEMFAVTEDGSYRPLFLQQPH